MILSFSVIMFYYKIEREKIMNFSLYTHVQNLGFSKNVDNSMKNSARATDNASNNRYFFVILFCNINFTILL